VVTGPLHPLPPIVTLPLATMTLGDLGADVVKVQRPLVGDETRRRPPPTSEDGQSTYYLAMNRNKRSLTLDLSTSDGCAAAKQPAPPAEVPTRQLCQDWADEMVMSWCVARVRAT
jgi:crotonobetainyl-CoA:carnitine CoA-transferase CaiB-like acyl-CoA transferase